VFVPFGWSQALVVSQIAISLLMLVAAGLFLHTLSNLQSIELGFNRENLLLFQLDARQAGHRDPEIAHFYGNLQDRFSVLPGVRNVSLSSGFLVGSGTMTMPIYVGAEQIFGTNVLTVGPAFFSTMQIPILLGREIGARDQPGSPAAVVVNELFAKAAFG